MAVPASCIGKGPLAPCRPSYGNACWWSSIGRSWHQCWEVPACSPHLWPNAAAWPFQALQVGPCKGGKGSWGCVEPKAQRKLRWWPAGWPWFFQWSSHADGSSYGGNGACVWWWHWVRRKRSRGAGKLLHSGPKPTHAGLRCYSGHQRSLPAARATAPATSNTGRWWSSSQHTPPRSLCEFGLGRRRCGSAADGTRRCSGPRSGEQWSRWRCEWRRTLEPAPLC